MTYQFFVNCRRVPEVSSSSSSLSSISWRPWFYCADAAAAAAAAAAAVAADDDDSYSQGDGRCSGARVCWSFPSCASAIPSPTCVNRRHNVR
jgi:hypothetical protein